MKGKFQAYMYLALAMLMVGSTVVASKIIASGLPPFTATALRFALAFPVFLILMRVSGVAWPKLRRAEWLILLIQAVAGSVGYTSLLIAGVRLTSAADAGVIIGTLPICRCGYRHLCAARTSQPFFTDGDRAGCCWRLVDSFLP
ncbi:DMT family transporter [Undibacterium sp. TJN19]|uniref:DMT family transporter n=1 Tax=Undibacterium sp. TJN19 TaxID=3413055 RepID=UPI003BF29621